MFAKTFAEVTLRTVTAASETVSVSMLKKCCQYGICKPIESNFGKYDMVTLAVATAMLSFITLALTVANATVSVNVLKKIMQV